MGESLTLTEIAERINKHLNRFEEDVDGVNKWDDNVGVLLYYLTSAHAVTRGVRIAYVRYKGTYLLKKKEALGYLNWLDAGNVGRHYEQQKEKYER